MKEKYKRGSDPIFTHKGLVLGFIPVYLGDIESGCPFIEARYLWAEWLIDAVDIFVRTFDFNLPIKITSEK